MVGPNGAGKSTLIKLLVGLTRPTSGFVSIGGEPPVLPRARRDLAYLAEVPSLPLNFNPVELITFTAGLLGRRMTPAQVMELLEKVDLAHAARRRVGTFSKGMRQRLGLALAQAGQPKILILDEPMSGLDPLGRSAVKKLILEMAKEETTIFYSSHVLSDVEEICETIFVMHEGEIKKRGTLLELAPYRDGLILVYRPKNESVHHPPVQMEIKREELARWSAENENAYEVLEVRPVRDSLEDILLQVANE